MSDFPQELVAEIKEFIKYDELYYVDYRDSLDEHPEMLQDILRTGHSDNDVYEWWDADTSYIRDDIIKHFSERYSEEFFEENFDTITDIIYDTCSNDPMPQLLKNTRDQNIVIYVGNVWDITIDPVFERKHELSEWDEATIKVGMLLGKSEEFMQNLYLAEEYYDTLELDDFEKFNEQVRKDIMDNHKLWRKYYSIYNEWFWYSDVYVAFRLSASEIADFHECFKSGDKVHLRNGDVWVINNSEWSGWMDSNTFPYEHEPEFILDMNRVYIDSTMKRYPYYAEVCGGEATDWYLKVIESAEVAIETPQDPQQAITEQEAAYDKAYKAWGCTFGDTKMSRHHKTTYINEFPCGTHCLSCGQFWID